MTTPISDFVKKYADSGISRFHMPGHKGKSFLGCEPLDITEINGADVLGAASGLIDQSEKNASALFDSAHSFYSTEGSSLAIKAMLALIKKSSPAGQQTTVLAARNAHKAFIYACALLDIDAQWIYPKNFEHLCSCKITPKELDEILRTSATLPNAVYITSPDYLGNIADVEGLAKVCHSFSIPLLVDNAHGAYLAFLERSEHPLALGADMCCDSAHKTLPVLTGGAYLHVSKSYTAFSKSDIRATLSLFASTSPSYLILQSLDLCNAYLSNEYRERLNKVIENVQSLKKRLSMIGFPPVTDEHSEKLKIVFSRQSCGLSGNELAEHLSLFKVEPEFCDDDYLVLMVTPELSSDDFDRVYKAFASIKAPKCCKDRIAPPTSKPEAKMSIRDAIFSASENIRVENAQGRICASPTVSCPPAVPIVVSGEIIDKSAIDLLLYYGVETIDVVK